MYFLQEAENISTVVPRVLPPKINEMTGDPDGTYDISWEDQNPSAADLYQLDELTGFSLWRDNVELGSNLWVFDGFSVNTSKYHSIGHSYQSRNKSRDVSTMTSVFPVPITEWRKLSFWCWYSIEKNNDYAFVEVSHDGRYYDLLDTFTGASVNWTYKEYDLTLYAGDSLFLRFRYTTNDRRTNEGFFVDDIAPVADFKTVTTLSNSISNHFYQVTGKTNGTYFYRVMGHNTAREWGDFSTLQMLRVGKTSVDFTISSPLKNYVYFMNRKLIPFFATLVFGVIDIRANVTNPSEVKQVSFYLDGTLQYIEYYEPYQWTWSKKAFLRHSIKVVVSDTANRTASDEIRVWKFF
jgi:hypothetical protein